MLTNIVDSEWKEHAWHELAFDDGRGNGFAFPCDELGNVPEDLNPAARENLDYCRQHPEKFARFAEVVTIRQQYRDPAHGRCECGREVYLQNQYYGACSCECGRWYNLFGQELTPPSEWEPDYEY